MLPSGFPVFVGVRGLHNKLFAGEREGAREVFADEGAHECALDVVGEGVGVFVDLVCAEGGFVAALRILLRLGRGLFRGL